MGEVEPTDEIDKWIDGDGLELQSAAFKHLLSLIGRGEDGLRKAEQLSTLTIVSRDGENPDGIVAVPVYPGRVLLDELESEVDKEFISVLFNLGIGGAVIFALKGNKEAANRELRERFPKGPPGGMRLILDAIEGMRCFDRLRELAKDNEAVRMP